MGHVRRNIGIQMTGLLDHSLSRALAASTFAEPIHNCDIRGNISSSSRRMDILTNHA